LTALGPNPEVEPEASVQLALAGMMGVSPYFPRFHYYRAASPERFIAAAERAAELWRTLDDKPRLARALGLAAMHLLLADRRAEAARAAEAALNAARECGNPKVIALGCYAQSFAIDRGSTLDRIALLTEAFDVCRDRSPFTKALVLYALGEVAFESGDPLAALSYARQSVLAWEGTPSSINQAQMQVNIAAYLLALGRDDEARAVAHEALTIAHRLGDPMIAGAGLLHVAGVAAARGDAQRAAQLLGASDACRGPGQPRLFTEKTSYDRTTERVRETLSAHELEGHIRDGRGWSIDHALEQAAV
jgi:tetratricopeptide (TPR) repeat protein